MAGNALFQALHIRDNFVLFDLTLSETEMAEISEWIKKALRYQHTGNSEMVPPVDEQK